MDHSQSVGNLLPLNHLIAYPVHFTRPPLAQVFNDRGGGAGGLHLNRNPRFAPHRRLGTNTTQLAPLGAGNGHNSNDSEEVVSFESNDVMEMDF